MMMTMDTITKNNNSQGQSAVLTSTSNSMSHQQLWNLLQGRVVVATDDVVVQELQENVTKIASALTYYKPNQGGGGGCGADGKDKKEELIHFPALPKFIREDATDDGSAEDPSKSKVGEPSGAGASASNQESFDQLKKAVAQGLDLDVNVAEELVVNYMMFEYKGSCTTYDGIVDTHRSFLKFLKELTEYYMKERVSLLLCTQFILSRMEDEDDNFYNITETFRSLISTKEWSQGLLNSIKLAKDEFELIEILHCLLLLTYKLPQESIPELLTYFSSATIDFSSLRKSEALKMAEGALMYSTLLVAGITDCCSSIVPTEQFSPMLRDFLTNHFDTLLLNPFNMAPVFACYDLFCKEDHHLTLKMKSISCNPALTFDRMAKLAEKYGRGSLSDRHSISLILSASLFEVLEVLLANYDSAHFGTKAEGFSILSKILQHGVVAEDFLCRNPPAITVLYTEATKLFPIDVSSILQIWKSLCISVRNKKDCNTLMSGDSGVPKLNCIAEYFDDEQVGLCTRQVGNFEMLNLKSRMVFGIDLEVGARGTINMNEDEIPFISWELPSSSNANAFSAIRSIIEPMAEEFAEMEKMSCSSSKLSPFDINYMPEVVFAVAEFISHFMENTEVALDEVNFLVHPICIILERMLKISSDMEEKGVLVKHLLGVVGAVNEFLVEDVLLFNYIYDVLPGGGGEEPISVVEIMISRRESGSVTNCEVTLSFLSLMVSFAENEKVWNQGHSVFSSKFLKSIRFISQTILPTCSSWRTGNEGIRLQIYLKCLQIFSSIYSLDKTWNWLKKDSIKFLISSNSCLLKLLGTDETLLQDSIIKPTQSNKLVGEVVCTALKLLHKVILFEKRVLVSLDQKMQEGNLVRVLGRHTRHRLNPMVPTLALMILKQIAEHSNISLGPGFVSDESAFREVMIQRLEILAEDINLKIAILDFLTVASQTQMDIMQSFFRDGTLENIVLDLIQQNEDLSSACLNFFRSLFKQNFPLESKSRVDFWMKIMTPINLLQQQSRSEMVAATLHILIFELYNNGYSDPKLSPVLEEFFKNDQLKPVVQAVLIDTNEQSTKCLLALKHFFLLVLGRPQLSSKLTLTSSSSSSNILTDVQTLILERFWEICENTSTTDDNQVDSEEHRRHSKTLVELVTILTTGESCTSTFVSQLLLKLMKSFKFLSFIVKISILILCLLNKCLTHCKPTAVADGIIENTLRIIRTITKDSSINLVTLLEDEKSHPILTATSTIIKTIVEKQPFPIWGQGFQKGLVPLGLLSLACVGIKMEKAPSIVSSSLAALIALAEDVEGCKLLPVNGMSSNLWLHLHKFTEGAREEWQDVFVLCLNLNSKLLLSLKRDYLDEALAFWGFYSGYLNQKLALMMNLTEFFIRGVGIGIDPAQSGVAGEKSYKEINTVLSSNIFVLNGILTLIQYFEDWLQSQRPEVYKTIRGVFQVLQEVCGFLRLPLGMLEIKRKLWTICDLCIHILVKLKFKSKQDENFIEKDMLIPMMFQTGQLCIKTLASKDSAGVGILNLIERISSVLEKVMVFVHNFTVPVLEDATGNKKEQVAFRRECGTEVVSLIDGIRRLSIPKNDFLIGICTRMETKFK